MTPIFIRKREEIWQKLSIFFKKNVFPPQELLLEVFNFQFTYNEVYQQFCRQIGKTPDKIKVVTEIPFLPISAFKHHLVKTGQFSEEEIFFSSGTTLTRQSRHAVRSTQLYLENCRRIWQHEFGPVSQYCFLALLPGYLERQGSSLIAMADDFIRHSSFPQSGFYLRNHDDLELQLIECREKNIPTVLIGVRYALLDFTDKYTVNFPGLILMETGGMKGQREEMTKVALHETIKQSFSVTEVYSEYGMTELLSQAYSKGRQLFSCHSSMKVSITEMNDPFASEKPGKSGIVNITDLANIDSCCFIQTEDVGRMHHTNNFEIIGRLDIADLRGCNLLIDELE